MVKWIESEGKCRPKYSHLEDIWHKSLGIDTIKDSMGNEVHGPDVLTVLHDFYKELYLAIDQVTEEEIQDFLTNLNLLKIDKPVQLMGVITEQQVASAINWLNNGKSPGLDELTAEFYKHFVSVLAPILVVVFNSAFEL